MSRRASLPGAAELFRTTSAESDVVVPSAAHGDLSAAPVRQDGDTAPEGTDPHEPSARADISPEHERHVRQPSTVASSPRTVRTTRRMRAVSDRDRAPTGRERHDEKITVYCSADELLDLESARLTLRGEHGMAVDRGRIVREALAVVLADLEAKGDASILVRRLRES